MQKKDFFYNLLLATEGGWGEIIWLLYIMVYQAKKLASI